MRALRIERGTAAAAAALATVGSVLLAVPFGAALFGVAQPSWAATASGSGRVLAGIGLVVVAAWFARERDGPAGFTALLGALLAAVAAMLTVILAPDVLGGLAVRAAVMTQFVAVGVCFLAVGAAARDDRLTRLGEQAAAIVGLLSIGGALLPFVRLPALVGWALWFAWLAGRLALVRPPVVESAGTRN